MQYPGTMGAIVASTYRNLNDYVIPMLTRELWEALGDVWMWDELVVGYNKQDNIVTFKNGSKIYLRSCDRPDDLRGPNLGWFAIDEAAKVKYGTWKIMVGRIRKPPEKGFITTTPRGRDWIYDEFSRKQRGNYEYFTGATDENKNLSDAYIESLKESYSGSFLRQEFYGEFTTWEGLVYPDIAVETHHLDAPVNSHDYKYALAGCDWGWRDPSTILVGLVGSDGFLHVVDEYYKTRTPVETMADTAMAMKDKWDINTFWCDPSRPDSLFKFKSFGLNARKGKNEITPGIEEVSRLINLGLFRMDFNTCPNTANEFGIYQYPEDDGGRVVKDMPIDSDNHAMDALRYMALSKKRQGHASSRRTR